MYNKGILRNRNGNIWLVSGACTFAGGVIIGVAQPYEWRYNYTGWDDNQYYRFRDEELNKGIGWGLVAAGGAMIITGFILKSSGVKLVRKSVNMYNNEKSNSGKELTFTFSGNGAHLVFSF